MNRLILRWERLWMRATRLAPLRPLAFRLAACFRPPYKGRTGLARVTREAFVSWRAELAHKNLELGSQVFLGDDVVIYSADGTGSVSIDERSCLHRGVILETSDGGNITIGSNSHIQPGCQLSAAKGSIHIGSEVQVAPACGFYPYSHGIALGKAMREQPVTSKGDITLGDDVWIGYGAVLLEGAKVGEGAIVAAGAVVRDEVPPYAIAAGVPAKVVGHRQEHP